MANPVAAALVRWQHQAGDYWPYVCAAPFIGDAPELYQSGGVTALPARGRPPSVLARTLDQLSPNAPVALLIDLPPAQSLAATPRLNRHGFVVVPIIQRWLACPAVLSAQPLLRQLVRYGRVARAPTTVRGVALLLDGERAGSGGRRDTLPRPSTRAFDNRYGYPLCRFPPAHFLRARGITTLLWVSSSGLAEDVLPYADELDRNGIAVIEAGKEPWTTRSSSATLDVEADARNEPNQTAVRGRPHPSPLPRGEGIGSPWERGQFQLPVGEGIGLPGREADPLSPWERVRVRASPDVTPIPIGSLLGETSELASTSTSPPIDHGMGNQSLPARYRRLVRRAQVDGFLADHLVRGEPYLAPDVAWLSPADDALLRRLTETFASAFGRAGRALAADVAGLEELGFPWVAAELLHAEPARVPLLGRFDFVRDETGRWWLLEFNADTPSGLREACAVEETFCALGLAERPFYRPSVNLGKNLTAAFCDAMAGVPVGRALGFVTDASELEDLAQLAFTARLLRAQFDHRGIPIVLGDVADLRATSRGLQLRGQPVGAVYRYFPFETAFGSPAFAAVADAVAAGKVRLLNGLFGLLLQHKGVLAWLWKHRDSAGFSVAERAAIGEHVPGTWKIEEFTPSPPTPLPPGERGDTVPSASPTPLSPGGRGIGGEGVVVKQVFGREGEEVYFGADLTDAQWAQFRQQRTYVVQERVAIAPQLATIATANGLCRATGYPTVGAYAVNGRWAGYYSRFGGPIITSRAKWLATLVDVREEENQ
jgi:glutathionylspermidine synthase